MEELSSKSLQPRKQTWLTPTILSLKTLILFKQILNKQKYSFSFSQLRLCSVKWIFLNRQVKLIFLIKSFICMTKKSRQKLKDLDNEKSFQGEIKRIFHHFSMAFSYQKWSQTFDYAFKSGCLKKFLLNLFNIIYWTLTKTIKQTYTSHYLYWLRYSGSNC